jgi:hypothetical protein
MGTDAILPLTMKPRTALATLMTEYARKAVRKSLNSAVARAWSYRPEYSAQTASRNDRTTIRQMLGGRPISQRARQTRNEGSSANGLSGAGCWRRSTFGLPGETLTLLPSAAADPTA